ncbi:MAG: hypothetical protein F6K55_37060, partial [Moorea sp. SIO4A3]|nr:hypothetical protein [Moorena sp. SIO4A3]
SVAQLLEKYGEFKVTRLPAVKDKQNNTIRVGKKTKVTLTQLEDAIVQLFKPNGKPPDTALLYFSGHGLRKSKGIQEGFLATSDVNPDMGSWGLSLQWLRRLLQESEVRQQVVILDCCYAGEVLNVAEADPGDRGKGRDRCFIAASRAFELAYEEIGSNHSVLTSALIKGLEPTQEQWVTNYTLVHLIDQERSAFPQCPIFSNFGGPINLTRRWKVDLVFKDSIDWQTFLKTFKDLIVESDTGELAVIQTIKNKDDGTFVIRVKFPEKVDEAEYEQKFWAKYKPMLEAKDREIKRLYEQKKISGDQIHLIRKNNIDLIKVIETMAEKETIRIDRIDRRDHRGAKFNVGGNYVERADSVSRQQGYAKQTNYEAPDKNLVEAAVEIQQLLDQLSQSNPTTTSKEKMIVVSEFVDQIENNPTLKAKVINALKAGGVEAFKEALDHPLVNILMATIEGWTEA